MGHPGHRDLTRGYWPADHGDLFAAAAYRQRGGLCRGETTSYGKLAETVERVTKQTFAKSVFTLPALQEELRLQPDDPMLRYRVAFARERECGGR